MPLPSLRRLALSDLDETALRRLVEHGEDLLVERKREPPKPPGLGSEIASFANTLGGWLLLGVNDDRSLAGWNPPKGLDLQSHIGNLLRNQVDPVPPFVADTRELDGNTVGVVRVFESTDTPVLVRQSGAVYVRDSGGKQPIRDHQVLIELARRGERTRSAAATRLENLQIIRIALRGRYNELDTDTGPDLLGATVKIAPFTVTPHYADWVVSGAAAAWSEAAAETLTPKLEPSDHAGALTRPFGRGLNTHRLREQPPPGLLAQVAVDAGGVVGAQLNANWEPDGFVTPEVLRDERITPLLTVCADALKDRRTTGRQRSTCG